VSAVDPSTHPPGAGRVLSYLPSDLLLQFFRCSVHIFTEICITLTLFLMLCDTYLFKVGLLGVLFTHFRAVFCLQPIYLLFTLFLDGTRVVSMTWCNFSMPRVRNS
jgi:hypothetical protein